MLNVCPICHHLRIMMQELLKCSFESLISKKEVKVIRYKFADYVIV